jgi:hypothetical protein
MRKRKVTPIARLPKSQSEGKRAQAELAGKLKARGDNKVRALDFATAMASASSALDSMTETIRKLTGVSGKASVSLFGLKVVVNPMLDPMDMIMDHPHGIVYVGEDKWEAICKASEVVTPPLGGFDYLGREDFKEGSKS